MKHTTLEIVLKSIGYLENKNFTSYDVFDALNSRVFDKLLKKTKFIRRVAIQLNAKSPINFRPLIGIKPIQHTKTISDMLSIYSMMYIRTNDEQYRDRAKDMFQSLWNKRIEVEKGIGWGLCFPYTTRFTNAASDTPNLYNTINATHSIIDFYEICDEIKLKEIINKVLYFILEYLGIIDESENTSWIRYYPSQVSMPTPNVNATAASLFVRINHILKEELIERSLIDKLLNFVITTQNKDGSWYYTTTANGKWIDGFHTGFILESLALVKHLDSGYPIENTLKKGSQFFLTDLFDAESIPKFFHNQTYPIESQNSAQAIQTLAKLILYDNQNLNSKLNDTMDKVVSVLYNENGFFYHKKTKFLTYKQFYGRWSQTPMIMALLYSMKINYIEK